VPCCDENVSHWYGWRVSWRRRPAYASLGTVCSSLQSVLFSPADDVFLPYDMSLPFFLHRNRCCETAPCRSSRRRLCPTDWLYVTPDGARNQPTVLARDLGEIEFHPLARADTVAGGLEHPFEGSFSVESWCKPFRAKGARFQNLKEGLSILIDGAGDVQNSQRTAARGT
jgi:hypothetical protein